MLAQAISSTVPVTASRMISGVRASLSKLLCPRLPGSVVISLALKRAIVWSLMPFCSGASTSLTIALYGPLIATVACSIDTPGFRRANR